MLFFKEEDFDFKLREISFPTAQLLIFSVFDL